MRTMYDAVTPENVPVNAQMVAGYIDGHYRSYAGLVARCPNAVHVAIAVNAGTNGGQVLDVETGDATPGEAPAWCQMRRSMGQVPTVYCSEALWQSCRNSFHLVNVPEPEWWIAAYPGNGPNLYPGSVAHQYDSPGPYDVSVVADYWPGVDSAPVPVPTEEDSEVPRPVARLNFDPNFYYINPGGDRITAFGLAVGAELHKLGLLRDDWDQPSGQELIGPDTFATIAGRPYQKPA